MICGVAKVWKSTCIEVEPSVSSQLWKEDCTATLKILSALISMVQVLIKPKPYILHYLSLFAQADGKPGMKEWNSAMFPPEHTNERLAQVPKAHWM